MRKRISQILHGAVRTYRTEGLFAFVQRCALWLKGERRSYAPPAPVLARESAIRSSAAVASVVHLAEMPLAPVVSVIIPVYNALEFATRCVDSLFRAKCSVSFEVILVDNGSRPDVARWMRQVVRTHPAVTAIRVETNIGYGSGMNLGSRFARGEFLLLANSDTEYTDDSLDLLVEAMRRDPLIGVLSPITNYVGEGPQLAQDARDLKPEQAAAYALRVRDNTAVITVAERLAFFCVMVRKATFQLLNGFDEGFQLGNFEDENFCSRTLLIGLKLAILQNSFVYHHGSKTFQSNAINHTQLMALNTVLYQNRLAVFSTDVSLMERKRFTVEASRRQPRRAPRISVLVRTRNRAGKLRNALISLAQQTFTDFEVVVVNDAGEDIAAVLQPFEAFFPIQYVRHDEPRMMSGASNSALDAMRGEFFIHLDDDDIVYPHHLASLHDLSLRHPDDRVFYSHYNRVLMEEDGDVLTPVQRVNVPMRAFDPDALLEMNYIVVHSSMFHRAVHDEIGLYDPTLHILPDWDYLIRASQRYVFIPLNRVTCEYRFYTTLTNSLVRRHERTFAEMKQVYQCHPVTRPAIELARQANLAAYERNMRLVMRLRDEVERGEKTERQAYAETLHVMMDFALNDEPNGAH